MRHEASKKLFNYWDNLRGVRRAPERSEIEPSDLRHILGDTFILEIDPQMRMVSFRLAGTRLCSSYGRELKGYGFLGMWDERCNLEVVRTVGKVYRDMEVAVISYTGHTENKRMVDFEMILLPLLQGHDTSIRTLGIATPRNVPFWLGSDPIINNEVLSSRTYDPSITNIASPPGLVPTEKDLARIHADRKSTIAADPNLNVQSIYTSPPLADPTGEQGKRFGHLRVLDGGLQD